MKDLKAQYLQFYKRADDILKQPGNPCDIKHVDGVVTCTVSRGRYGKLGFPHGTLCCGGCEHHDKDKGCTVEALACKLGWCYVSSDHIQDMQTKDHPMFVQLAALREEVLKSDVPLRHRASVEQTFAGRNKVWRI